MATNTIDFGKIYETTNFGNGVDDNTIDWGKVYKNLGGETKFVFSVQTDNAGTSNDDQFTLPLITSTDLDITVEWGDGSSDNISNHEASEVTHTYASAGEYTIKIDGILRGFRFDDGGDKLKIKDVSNWGVMLFDFDSSFRGCTNLTCSATDAITVIGTSLRFTFLGCENFNGAIGNWDVSNVTDMLLMLRSASSFNQDVGSWNVSNVTDMSGLFRGASIFNKDLSGWNDKVGNVTSMNSMFRDTAFNQNINGWNVSNVESMREMFKDATSFNQPLFSWDVSSVTNMSEMFRNATSFNREIGDWDISIVADFSNFMLGVTLSTANYDDLLIGWASQSVIANITINFGGSQYSSGAAATARQTLTDAPNNWVITDGGQV